MENVSQTVEAKVAGYIAENILFNRAGYPYPLEASFVENGIIDSMNVLELVMFVEETFPIKVDDADIIPANFDSVAQLAAYIRAKTNQ